MQKAILKTFVLGLATMGSLVASHLAMADGAELYTEKMCNTCHGLDANKALTKAYPKLGGQNKDYMIQQMKDIRDEKRKNGLSMAMKPLTAAITDDEFAAIAEWIASAEKTFFAEVEVNAEADGAKLLYGADKYACNACHGEDGKTPVISEENGNPPVIAGQNEAYMLTQMKDIRDGKRANANSALMKAKTEGISDADFEIMAKWLAGPKKK